MTWAELRDAAADRLRAGGIEQPGVEVGWMLEEVSGLDAAEQVAEAHAFATMRAANALTELVDRRLAGEPLQYVLGSWSFCGIDLLVDRRVLIPRPETEVVAQVAIGEVARLGQQVGRSDPWTGALTSYVIADLGTGSGALAVALAFALPEAEVWATDIDEEALTVARANVAGAGSPCVRVRLAPGSWFAALPDSLRGRLLLAVANPPYLAERELAGLDRSVADWEPVGALVSGPTRVGGVRGDRRRGARVARPGWDARARAGAGSGRSSHRARARRVVPRGRGAPGSGRPRSCARRAARRDALGRVRFVADELDVDAMLARFRDRAARVKDRGMPPVAGPERERFLEQAAMDFQDYAIVGDATWTFEDGVLTLRVDLGS